MAKFSYFKRAGQDADTNVMEFEILRQKAGARVVAGSGFPDEFASALC